METHGSDGGVTTGGAFVLVLFRGFPLSLHPYAHRHRLFLSYSSCSPHFNSPINMTSFVLILLLSPFYYLFSHVYVFTRGFLSNRIQEFGYFFPLNSFNFSFIDSLRNSGQFTSNFAISSLQIFGYLYTYRLGHFKSYLLFKFLPLFTHTNKKTFP